MGRPGREKLRTALLLPTSAYGGYFGAGLGVMLLALLMISSHNEIRASNALKNLLATIISLATLMIFAVQGVIRWPETLVMLAGALCGGMLGGRLIAISTLSRARNRDRDRHRHEHGVRAALLGLIGGAVGNPR